MEHNPDRNRRLTDYIYNDLNPEEVVEMEKEISQDPQLSDSYELNMQVKNYLQAKIQLEEMSSDPQLEEADQLADLACENEPAVEAELKPIRRPGRKRSRNMLLATAIAAGVTIIIAVGIIPSRVDQDRLFDRYYAPVAASDNSQRGIDNFLYQDLAAGINQYRDGNYQKSIEHLNSLASNPSIQSDLYLYSGLSYLGLGQYENAKNMLESVLADDTRFQAQSLWYLSLCCLKTGELEEASRHLEQLEAYDGLYKKDAQTLRKKLRRLIP